MRPGAYTYNLARYGAPLDEATVKNRQQLPVLWPVLYFMIVNGASKVVMSEATIWNVTYNHY